MSEMGKKVKSCQLKKNKYVFFFPLRGAGYVGRYFGPPPPWPLKHLFFSCKEEPRHQAFIEMSAHIEQNQLI